MCTSLWWYQHVECGTSMRVWYKDVECGSAVKDKCAYLTRHQHVERGVSCEAQLHHKRGRTQPQGCGPGRQHIACGGRHHAH
eukprot:1161265-Pelagomonas_calceolata.AAC.4